ncbi:MAG: S8 family serine peptidase [Nesterenkonia sp.]|nr:S8 family serine peptidase [Nesterenkonia sp.]
MTADPHPTRSRRPRSLAAAWAAALVAVPLVVAPPAQSSPEEQPDELPDELPDALLDELRDSAYWLEDYGVEQAWETTRGEGVRIAVLDTGVDGDHPVLEGAVTGGTDVSGSGGDGGPVEQVAQEHGTLVASLAAGRGVETAQRDESGVVGVAPEAEILSVSMDLAIDDDGGTTLEDQVVEAVDWAVENDADIINMSFSMPDAQQWPESWDEAFLRAEQEDVLVVAAAGNRMSGHWSVGAPATVPGVLTVAGVDEEGRVSEDASSQGISIDISAAAEPLVGAIPDGDYAEWTGTSGAAPIVSGAAALVMAAHPDLSAAEVRERLKATATSAADGAEEGSSDPVYGSGILDVGEAVTASEVPDLDESDQTLEEWIRIHRRDEGDGDDGEDGESDTEETEAAADGEADDDGAESEDGDSEGAPREMPEARATDEVQSWAGPAVVIGAGVVILGVVVAGAAHLVSRRRRSDSP